MAASLGQRVPLTHSSGGGLRSEIRPTRTALANTFERPTRTALANTFEEDLFRSILSSISASPDRSSSDGTTRHASTAPRSLLPPVPDVHIQKHTDASSLEVEQPRSAAEHDDIAVACAPAITAAAEPPLSALRVPTTPLHSPSTDSRRKSVCIRVDEVQKHWFYRLQKVMLMAPPTHAKQGYGPLRYIAGRFFRYFGQFMMLFCDALMVYRMVHQQSFHITVSIMCPVFHIGVLAITWQCDAAIKAMRLGMFDVPVDAVLLRKAQSAIAFISVVVIMFMVVLFVIWTPLTQAEEGTILFSLSSLHRVWLTDVMMMYKNLAFLVAYSVGLIALGFMWFGVIGAYCNGAFIAWCRLRDCSNLVEELKLQARKLTYLQLNSNAERRMSVADEDDSEDETFQTLLASLVEAVNDCMSARAGMTSIIRLGFISVIFDIVLVTLFLVFSLLIVSCSSFCQTYGSEAYYNMSRTSGVKPCVYTMENAFSVLIWTTGVLMHLLAWLFPLAILNQEIQSIREELIHLPLGTDGRFIHSRTGRGIPRFMRRYLESYEHALLVQTFSNDSNLIAFALPFVGAVSFGTVSTLLSCIATLYTPAPNIIPDV